MTQRVGGPTVSLHVAARILDILTDVCAWRRADVGYMVPPRPKHRLYFVLEDEH
jgi:hypothetical protein